MNLQVVIPETALRHLKRHRNRGSADFPKSLADDYRLIERYLPEKATRIIDIGCGMAGIDVLLKRRYPDAELWLLDGDGDDPRDGWNETLGAFSSRDEANKLLEANGLQADRWLDIGTKEHLQADLIISLASWGYHYPISTYHVTGYCIADLRKKVEPRRGKVIMEYPKRLLCAWRSE